MDEIHKRISTLGGEIDGAIKRLDLDGIKSELEELREAASAADFWVHSTKAQDVSKKQANVEQRLEPWENLQKELKDVKELADLEDDSVKDDLSSALSKLE